jgi:hypothetical protein
MTDRSRRNFLKTSVSATGLCLAGPSAVAHALLADGPEHPPSRLEPFPLASVRLAPGIFKQQEEINARYLDSLTVDRLLHSFRVTAGISSSCSNRLPVTLEQFHLAVDGEHLLDECPPEVQQPQWESSLILCAE